MSYKIITLDELFKLILWDYESTGSEGSSGHDVVEVLSWDVFWIAGGSFKHLQ